MKRYKSEVAIERSIKCVVKEVKMYDSNWEVFLFGKKKPTSVTAEELNTILQFT